MLIKGSDVLLVAATALGIWCVLNRWFLTLGAHKCHLPKIQNKVDLKQSVMGDLGNSFYSEWQTDRGIFLAFLIYSSEALMLNNGMNLKTSCPGIF